MKINDRKRRFFQTNRDQFMGMNPAIHRPGRCLRAWFYRHLPVWNRVFFLKKLAGYERRWDLERRGFTKRGFIRLFLEKAIPDLSPGLFYELQAGDGLVGSLGCWLEKEPGPWKVEAWEHRKIPAQSFAIHRPLTLLHRARVTHWEMTTRRHAPIGMTIRGSREASGVCRALREGALDLQWVGIWNPRRQTVWWHRLERLGFKLELVYERMEFYRKRGA